MHRVFAKTRPENGRIRITGADARHLVLSLRCAAGEKLIVCGGTGTDYLCELTRCRPEEAVARVLEERASEGEPGVRLCLYPSLAKGERFEWLLQKCVELGACEITPVLSARCIAAPPEGNKPERWQRIMREAAMQTGRGVIPALNPPLGFSRALESAPGLRLFCSEAESSSTIGMRLAGMRAGTVSVMTGPEGGYTPEEMEKAQSSGWLPVTLGKRILRCETAPVVALTVILTALGEM